MAIDPSISLGYRPPQVNLDIPSPIQQFGQMMSLRGLMEQSQQRQLQMQGERLDLEQKQRTAREQQALTDYLTKATSGAQTTPPQTPASPATGPASIGQMMTPAPAPSSAPQIGGLHMGEILRVAPTLGPAFIKTHLGLQQSEAEAQIKQHDALAKKAEGLGSLGISIRDAKDPEARFAPAIWEGMNNGLISPEVGRQMIQDGYAKHAGDVDAFINGALGVKDHAVAVKDDLEALGKAKDNAGTTIRGVNDQAGYNQWLSQQDRRIQAILGPTYSPQLKNIVQDWGVSAADLPKTVDARRAAAAPVLMQAFKQGPEAFQSKLATFPQDVQDAYSGVKSVDDINRQALTPDQRRQADQAAAGTEIADLDVNGKPHKVLVNKQTGAVVKDLGESGFKPQQINVNAATSLLDRESARFAKPHEKAVADANSQLEKINDARAMINGSAEAQALGLPKVLTALVGGQGSGVRVTQPELNSLAKARGITGDVEGFIRKASGGGALTKTQQQQLTQLMDDVAARIKQKQQIANDALDRINSAGSRDEIVAIDSDVRKKLSGMESPAANQPSGGRTLAAPSLPSTLGAADKGKVFTNNKGERIRVTDVNPANPKQFKYEVVN